MQADGNSDKTSAAVSSEARPLQVPRFSDIDDTVDIFELAYTLWTNRWRLFVNTLAFSVAGIAYAFWATEIYQVEVVLAPNKLEQGPNLPSGIGGLASIAGINLGFGTDGAESLAVLRSRGFIEEFLADKNLLPILFKDEWDESAGKWKSEDPDDWPTIWDGVRYFTEEVRFITEDASSGLVTLAIEWEDPELAKDWVDDLVHRINERMRERDLADSQRRLDYLNDQLETANLVELRQAISRLIENEMQTIMLASGETQYAFEVIDPPRVPNDHISPNRPLIALLATILGLLVSFVIALIVLIMTKRKRARSPE